MLVAYVSGHGFGHSTRTGEVLRALREREPGLPITVVTSAPESLYRSAVPGTFAFRELECDVGLLQDGPLVIDEDATARRWAGFQAGAAERIAAEAKWLRAIGARLVMGDVPPLGFAAAAAADVPSVALANFSWDWIYRHLATRRPELREAAEDCAAAYAQAGLLLELPFTCDMPAFPRREAIPLVARRPRMAREETRRRLGLGGEPTVLVSFGGLGFPGFSLDVLGRLPRFRFVASSTAVAAVPNGIAVPQERLDSLGLSYPDLIGACDVVLTKPGYGIVSDAVGASVRLVYTDRGDFPEYPVFVRDMPSFLPAVHVTQDELKAGRLEDALERVLAVPYPAPADLSGAAVAAERLLEQV